MKGSPNVFLLAKRERGALRMGQKRNNIDKDPTVVPYMHARERRERERETNITSERKDDDEEEERERGREA